MSIGAALTRARAFAETLMVDTCAITRVTGETVAGGVITSTWSTVYSGKCRVQITTAAAGQGTDVGEAFRLIERREVQLPMTATGLQEGDRVTITAAVLDPDLAGRVYAVRDVAAKSHLTMRRVSVIEVTS